MASLASKAEVCSPGESVSLGRALHIPGGHQSRSLVGWVEGSSLDLRTPSPSQNTLWI